ncbi:metal-dependent hydrolase [Halopseudomonas formosensis]|uniref:Metal-dependent hydrolase n=1 Tax=Halopseudomonas formosensis TaxID=1002526 RepID=A0ABU5BXZ9_9GAMM|nr:metal-dependent hydrolase [Halopseudomonas formosensis]MDX9686986.1 metal-dependent hydrolase [Halopseudomonas formosensis]
MLSSTPDHLDIRPRRLNAALPDPLPRWWLGNDPFRTHFFNAMSVLFPDGEQFFIDSVRHFRDRVTDPALAQQIRGFIGQEAHHSREHIEYNQRLRDLGYDIDALERPVRQRIRWIHKNFSPERQLAATVALEHFTAIMADTVLRHPHWLADADPEMRRLWRWHALEETEHKSVAFDVYMQVCGDRRMLRRAMRLSTFFFLRDVTIGTLSMLRRDGQLNLRTWWRGMRWLWGKGGFFRHLLGAYRDFFRRDFHPWKHDNSALMHQVASEYSDALVR